MGRRHNRHHDKRERRAWRRLLQAGKTRRWRHGEKLARLAAIQGSK